MAVISRKIKKLSFGLKMTGGRNNRGRICSFHRGGGHKKSLRFIDFSRHLNLFYDLLVLRIEKDPIRNTDIALVLYENGVISYILGFQGIFVGQVLPASYKIDLKALQPGFLVQLKDIAVGKTIHNIEQFPFCGSKYLRSAGVSGILLKKNNKVATIKMPSNYLIDLNVECFAIVGESSNKHHYLLNLKKAGDSRHLGRRPVVRGVAMNPVDHPHGGGEGKSSGGRPSVSPWGKLTKGKPTVKNKKYSKLK